MSIRSVRSRLSVALLELLVAVVLVAAVVLPLVLFDGYGRFWWLDELAHLCAGVALALLVHLVVGQLLDSSAAVTAAMVTVLGLQIGWEAFEWWAGIGVVPVADAHVRPWPMTRRTARTVLAALYVSGRLGVALVSNGAGTAVRQLSNDPTGGVDAARTYGGLVHWWLQQPKTDDTMLDVALALNGAYVAVKVMERLSSGDETR